MLRNFGISLLFLGLLAAGFEGFRERARVRTIAPATEAAPEDGNVHHAEAGIMIPPR